MKAWIIVTLSIALLACTDVNQNKTTPDLTEGQSYFLEIALGSEYGNSAPVIKKWTSNIRIALNTSISPELQKELTKIITELNQLSRSISIAQVAEPQEANVLVFISDAQTYGNYEPNARPYFSENLGFFWVYWKENYAIYKASLYVEESLDTTCQKHVLREELTQLLGLMNDSYKYPNSIFYQGWSCTPFYTELDKEVIGYILNPNIKPGMTRAQLENFFREMNSKAVR